MAMDKLVIKGAREHNLKNVDLTIPRDKHAGVSFSEAALVDSNGTLCAIKNMYPKRKDADVTFVFEFDDEF